MTRLRAGSARTSFGGWTVSRGYSLPRNVSRSSRQWVESSPLPLAAQHCVRTSWLRRHCLILGTLCDSTAGWVGTDLVQRVHRPVGLLPAA